MVLHINYGQMFTPLTSLSSVVLFVEQDSVTFSSLPRYETWVPQTDTSTEDKVT